MILFFKVLLRVDNFSPHVPVDIIKAFFIPEFVAENLKAKKNQQRRSLFLQYRFDQKTSLILRISSLLKLKKICSQKTAEKIFQ